MMPQNEQNSDYYEIDLRDYIEVVWRGKWLIFFIVLIAVGAALAFLSTKPDVYEAKTTLLVLPRISERLVQAKTEDAQGNVTIAPSSLSVEVYKNLALANDLLKEIIEKLDLKKPETGEPLAVSALKKKMEPKVSFTESRKEASLPLLTMRVQTAQKPPLAEQIADQWAESFIAKNTELLATETAQSYEFISQRFSEVSKNLKEKEAEEAAFRSKNSIEALQSEVKVLQKDYEELTSQLEKNKLALAEKKASVKALEQEIKDEPRLLKLQKTIPAEGLWEFFKGSVSLDQLKNALNLEIADEEINELYLPIKQNLVETKAEVQALKSQIEHLNQRTQELKTQIQQKSAALHQAQLTLDRMGREQQNLKDSYDFLAEKKQEAQIAKQEQASAIRVVEEAITPEVPAPKNTLLNLLIAAVLGGFIGVLTVFFRNYLTVD